MIDKPNWGEICKKDGLAEKVAKSFENTKSTQIRKFFNSVKKLKIKLDSGGDVEEIKAKLWQIVPQVEYAAHRKQKLVDHEFAEFIARGIEKTEKDSDKDFKEKLENFVKIFETVVAYSKKYEKR